jgi:hypothetical protein
LLKRAGIDRKYSAYSIRHALITALFDARLSESQVNAYTGHSNNAHATAPSYVHLNFKWIGHTNALSALSPAVFASTDRVVKQDNAERQVEEMEKYGEGETDVLGAPRPFSPVTHLSSLSSSSSSSLSSSSFPFVPHERPETTVAVGGNVREGISPSRGGSGCDFGVAGDPHRMHSFCLECRVSDEGIGQTEAVESRGGIFDKITRKILLLRYGFGLTDV